MSRTRCEPLSTCCAETAELLSFVVHWISSRYAGLKSVDLSQFGLRTMSIALPGTRPTTLPCALLRTMYGPLNATYWS